MSHGLLAAELAVRHAYYAPLPVAALRLQPTPATAQRMARAGLHARTTADGLALLLQQDDLALLHARVHDPQEPLQLVFTGRSSDPDFAGATAGLDALGVLDSQHAAAPDAAGWRVLQPPATGPLRELPEELPALDRRVPPAFVLVLRLDAAVDPHDTTPSALQAWAAQALGRRWLLPLQARTTHWKYLLPAEWAPQQPRVVDTHGSEAFTEPAAEALADGRPALAARSRQAIALHRRPAQRFQLQALAPAADKILVRRLPVASAGQLQMEEIDGVRTLVSEIHVIR
jgi:hypothetical protein